ncbi:MAG: hypothetical protein IPM64_04735 [Phycisphaerales bacterium]|nr:hypothetical protein [Phycisphaerales bacterium]
MARKGKGAGTAGAVQGLNAARSALLAQRDQLDRRIGSLDEMIADFGGLAAPAVNRGKPGPKSGGKRGPKPGPKKAAAPAARAGGPKPPRRGSLKEFILGAMKPDQVARVGHIADAVVKMGYKSDNKTLAKSTGIAMAEMVRSKHLRKVGRGRFKLR